MHHFTAVVGVFLSDVLQVGSGNLIVYPGTHVENAEVFKAKGVEWIFNKDGHHYQPLDLDPNRALPLMARAGDIVLMHYNLAHSIFANYSPLTRYAVYYRLISDKVHSRPQYESVKDLWIDWNL